MSQIQSIVNILQDLGCGLSVNTLIHKHNITFDELCNLASQNTQLKQQLNKWYPLYDFEVKEVVNKVENNDKETRDVIENKEQGEEVNAKRISTRKQTRWKQKRDSEQADE